MKASELKVGDKFSVEFIVREVYGNGSTTAHPISVMNLTNSFGSNTEVTLIERALPPLKVGDKIRSTISRPNLIGTIRFIDHEEGRATVKWTNGIYNTWYLAEAESMREDRF